MRVHTRKSKNGREMGILKYNPNLAVQSQYSTALESTASTAELWEELQIALPCHTVRTQTVTRESKC